MDHSGCFYIWPILKKIEGPYSRDMVEPGTEVRFSPRKDMLVVAPPDYPQLADGLEIGAFYDAILGPSGSHGHMHDIDSLDYYFEWCERLASLVTNGKKLKVRPERMVDWSNALSELGEDKQKYPETDGRGPFWELFRYGLRGMTFGPVACKKLSADFENWESETSALCDAEFSQMYVHIWSTFALADGTGMVTYPCRWYEDGDVFIEPKLGVETLKLFRSFDDI